jgi:serine/threonine protein phosphatase PrpC
MDEISHRILEAQDPNTPSSRLSELSFQEEVVRSFVAKNPNTPEYTLLRLAETFPGEVANNIAFALCLLERPNFILQFSEKATFAMASCEEVPESVLALLLAYPKPEVSALIVRRQNLSAEFLCRMAQLRLELDQLVEHPNFTEEAWLQLLQEPPEPKTNLRIDASRIFLARAERLPMSARAVLAESQDPQVQSALAWRDEPPEQSRALPLTYAGATETGQVRERNEDHFGMYHGETLSFFLVADGMGGQGSGEFASKAASEALMKEAKRADQSSFNAQSFLHHGFLAAHDAIMETGFQYHDLRKYNKGRKLLVSSDGSGTTASALLLQGDTAHIAQIGDSRVYLLRGGKLSQLTEDHSLLNELLRQGHTLTQEEIKNFPHKNVITRALGMERISSTPEITRLKVVSRDLFLLCTDGIFGMLNDQEIEAELQQANTIEQKVQALIKRSNEAGGQDNMAAVLVEVGSDG